MQNLIQEAPEVAQAFRQLTQSIDGYSPLDLKTKELILIGIFTADKAVRGIDTHVRIALEAGAKKDEIISAILYAMPIVGLPSVTLALGKALEIIDQHQTG
ncbi:carboxymuconolactone decarboxylase family protein [Gorillibacterium sp. CAU 1737]|uniref:carboxymuconolactone decarboxylase family protein n=1 Tax=Gorillibacterium sp. CAU 1737 TaxID=3140362 RepID=UPI0032619D7B